MAQPRINGTLLPIPKAPKVRYDPTRGLWYDLSWESAGDNLDAIGLQCLGARVSFQHVKSPVKSRIEAEASGVQLGVVGPYPDILTDNWQLLANEQQKDVKEHPTFLAMEQAYPGTIGYVVRDVLLYNQGKPPGDPAPNPAIAATAGLLAWLLVRGTTHYALGQYVLRHTTSASQAYSANVADVNVEHTYTTSQLLAEVTNSALWTYPLPPRMVYKIQNLPAPTAMINYLWGWRKLPSNEITAAGNRIEINTEYWLEQWSTVLYPPAI